VAHDGDRITFAVSGTITLTSGALVVAKSVTISGPGADQLSIVGIQFQSVFFVAVKAATISGLTIRNGAVGIDNPVGTLTVRNCVISGNSIDGIHNVASLTVVNSNVSDNALYGIYNITGEFEVVTATILSTTVSGNSAGGVVAVPNFFDGRAYITITDRTISGNLGGGIFGAATLLTVANSTISGNSAGTSEGGISLPLGRCALQIARSPATRHLLAGAFVTTGNQVSLRSPTQSQMPGHWAKTSLTTVARSHPMDTISAAMMAAAI